MTKHTFPLTCNQTHILIIFITGMFLLVGTIGVFDGTNNYYALPFFVLGMIGFSVSLLIKLITYLENNWKCRCNKK